MSVSDIVVLNFGVVPTALFQLVGPSKVVLSPLEFCTVFVLDFRSLYKLKIDNKSIRFQFKTL